MQSSAPVPDPIAVPAAPEVVSPGSAGAGALRSLGRPAYRWLWSAGLFLGFGNWMQRLTIGWLVLDQTGSVFLTALSFAVRSAPNLVFGPIGGALADRFPRRNLVVLAAILKVSVALGLWLLATADDVTIWAVFALIGVSGVTSTFEMPATQALAVDVVGRKDAANGIALLSVATRAVGAIGAITGGFLIEAFGPSPVFFLGAVAFAIGGVAVSRVRTDRLTPRRFPAGGVFGGAIEGLRILFGIPIVAGLLGLAMLVEALGFTFQSLMPAVADEILGVGPAGLGALTAMAGVGGLVGSLLITALADYRRKGLLTIGVVVVYGLGLLMLANSGMFPVSLAVIAGVGVMAASFDALQWTMLQANVPDDMRGRAMGGWIFAIGFGWVGSLELGLLAQVFSVAWALSVNGAGLVVLGLVAIPLGRRLRDS